VSIKSGQDHVRVHDQSVLPILVKDQKDIGKVYADGAYISKGCFDAIAALVVSQ
jgi:hypothetical protein